MFTYLKDLLKKYKAAIAGSAAITGAYVEFKDEKKKIAKKADKIFDKNIRIEFQRGNRNFNVNLEREKSLMQSKKRYAFLTQNIIITKLESLFSNILKVDPHENTDKCKKITSFEKIDYDKYFEDENFIKYLKDQHDIVINSKHITGNEFNKQEFGELTKTIEVLDDNAKGGGSNLATSPIQEFGIQENLEALSQFLIDLFSLIFG